MPRPVAAASNQNFSDFEWRVRTAPASVRSMLQLEFVSDRVQTSNGSLWSTVKSIPGRESGAGRAACPRCGCGAAAPQKGEPSPAASAPAAAAPSFPAPCLSTRRAGVCRQSHALHIIAYTCAAEHFPFAAMAQLALPYKRRNVWFILTTASRSSLPAISSSNTPHTW